jgi:HPt (histidine-containing phosphotransfer) domain-containing protein
MSLAYYIVLDRDDPGFDPFVNGKFMAAEAKRINKAAKNLGLKRLDDLTSYEELADEDFGLPPEEAEGGWFDPEEGLAWLAALLERFRQEPKVLKNAEGVIADLEECLGVLEKAKSAGARWHFALDM